MGGIVHNFVIIKLMYKLICVTHVFQLYRKVASGIDQTLEIYTLISGHGEKTHSYSNFERGIIVKIDNV